LFEELPQGHELPVIVEQARDAVETQFEQTPQQIIVSFALAP
jgi:hypothetical protein